MALKYIFCCKIFCLENVQSVYFTMTNGKPYLTCSLCFFYGFLLFLRILISIVYCEKPMIQIFRSYENLLIVSFREKVKLSKIHIKTTYQAHECFCTRSILLKGDEVFCLQVLILILPKILPFVVRPHRHLSWQFMS